MALKQQERFHEALALFDTAQARVPDMPAVDCNRASTLQQLGRIEEAARSYARAAARDPSQVEALAGLALMSALSGGFSTAATSGARAIALAPDHAIALIALAIVDIEAGDFDAARQKLCRVTGDREFESDKQASFALGFAADALERRGRYAEVSIDDVPGRPIRAGGPCVRARLHAIGHHTPSDCTFDEPDGGEH